MDLCLQRMLKYKLACSVSQRNLMSLVEGLCTGTGQLQRSNIVTLTAMLKAAQLPPSTTPTEEPESEGTTSTTLVKISDTRPISQADFLKQLMSAFSESTPHYSSCTSLKTEKLEDKSTPTKTDPSSDMQAYFAARNIDNLHALHGADILLDVCLNLPFLQRYINAFRDAANGLLFVLPSTAADASSMKASFPSLLNDMTIVSRVLALPTLEPMTPDHMEKLTTVVMSCLFAAVSATTTSTLLALSSGQPARSGLMVSTPAAVAKDEEQENIASLIVQKGLSLFKVLQNAVQQSTRAGGHNLQNLHMLGAWCILRDLDRILHLNASSVLPEKPKEKEKDIPGSQKGEAKPGLGKAKEGAATAAGRPGSAKATQNISSLTVALSSCALSLLTALLEDLHIEGLSTKINTSDSAPARLSILPQYTAWQRVCCIIGNIPLTNLLINLFTSSYKKACITVRQRKNSLASEGADTESNSLNTNYGDEFGSSEESSEDEDSEPILGPWFEETLTPDSDPKETPPNNQGTPPPVPGGPKPEAAAATKKEAEKREDSPSLAEIPDKEEPSQYLKLASDVLQFLTVHLLHSSNGLIHYFPSLAFTETHIAGIASVIKDLDKGTVKTDDAVLMDNFSAALLHFIHTLLASETLPGNFQDSLLSHLGVSPTAKGPWSLNIPPRTLAVLAHVLLQQQQQQQRSPSKGQQEAAVPGCYNVLQRILETLRDMAMRGEPLTESEDLNVEHAQLLMFIFESLPTTKKKDILLQTASALCQVSRSSYIKTKSPLALCRLLLIFEFFVHHFSQARPFLFEQVQWNIFTVQSTDPALMLYQEERGGIATTKFYNPCREVEENYRKATTSETGTVETDSSTFKRLFYNLISSDMDNGKEVPQLDLQACEVLYDASFDYGELYHSLVELLAAGSECDTIARQQDRPLQYTDACAIHYTSVVSWRLLGSLAPSVAYMKLLEGQHTDSERSLTPSEILHTLRWVPRMANDKYRVWIRDHLSEQRLPVTEAESLLDIITQHCSTVQFDIQLAQELIATQLSHMPLFVMANDIVIPTHLPSLNAICLLDCILSKVETSLKDHFIGSISGDETAKTYKVLEIASDLRPILFQLLKMYTVFARSCLLDQIPGPTTFESQAAFSVVLRVSSSFAAKWLPTASGLLQISGLPQPVRTAVEKWNANNGASETKGFATMRSSHAIASENQLNSVLGMHLNALSCQTVFSIALPLKHVMTAMVRLCTDQLMWCDEGSVVSALQEPWKKELADVLFPLLLDASTESFAELTYVPVERLLGGSDSEEFVHKLHLCLISACHELITKHASPQSGLEEAVFRDAIQTLEAELEKGPAKKALEVFYTEESDLVQVLLSSANEHLSAEYGIKVLKFFNRLLQFAEDTPGDKSLDRLCSSLTRLSLVDPDSLQGWLARIIQDSHPGAKGQEHRVLLQSLTSHIVKEKSLVGEDVATALLKALIPMGTQLLSGVGDSLGFSELMPVMVMLAGAGSGVGHIELFRAANEWLVTCKKYLSHKNVAEKLALESAEGKHQHMMEAACYLLSYIASVLGALKQSGDKSLAPAYDVDSAAQEADSDWAEDMMLEEDDSGGEDSDEDSLCNKLCTYTITQRDFMSQHWYHCHTCKMIDGVGICTVCARVCHRGHEVAYAKYGSFFCDCGDKDDGSCQALVKRTPGSNLDSSMSNTSMTSPFSSVPSGADEKTRSASVGALRRHHHHQQAQSSHQQPGGATPTAPSPTDRPQGGMLGLGEAGLGGLPLMMMTLMTGEELTRFHQMLAKQLMHSQDIILSLLENGSTAVTVMELLQYLLSPIEEHCNQTSAVGATSRAQQALRDLHMLDKTTESTEQLMVPTLGSQEGAFENVRANFSGDQGQTIRQLLGAHMLRRVAMCCLASPQGRRQHLAVCHEKGRITVLQLSALLKQADSSKRKLTLTRLSSAPVPFTVLSITGNPSNEDFLAVCGLKDCHVLTFTSSGTVSDHLVLHPQLEAGNFIIKAIWLPGSQTELAIVTADFVKIYDLSRDALSPCFYFLVPSGKIRDACFVFSDEDTRTLVLMSSAGYLYTQPMVEASEARHGPFYVTNVLEVKHDELKDSGGQVAGGGVSCYYSHTLQLLFFSFSQGKSFCASINKQVTELGKLFPITLKSNGSSGGKATNPPALCQWSEVSNHPGLVCCLTQTTSIPVLLMVEPDCIRIQEIKTLPAKAKVQDMVAIRHSSSSDQHRTTLILLCEDGSLRIYMANVDQTGYWMSSQFQATGAISALKPIRKKKVTKSGSTGRPSGVVTFPIDFFEHCQPMNDVEFGGNDLLQVYNVQQVKHRLNTTGMYVANTKPGGFMIEVINNNSSMVMVGIRVHVGAQSIERVPSYLEVFGRSTQVQLTSTRNRWFDIPFTREESLTADKKFTLFVGPSVDPAGVTMVDSIKVYGKTKENFGWPDDPPDDFPSTSGGGANLPPTSSSAAPAAETETATVTAAVATTTLSSLDRLVAASLEVLDGFVCLVNMEDKETIKQTIQDLATELLTLPTPSSVQSHAKSLLSTMQPSSVAFHNHKDQAQLQRVIQCLASSQKPQLRAQAAPSCQPDSQQQQHLDPEAYQRLVVTARSVAVARPTNLVRFADTCETFTSKESDLEVTNLEAEAEDATMEPASSRLTGLTEQESKHFLARMLEAFWRLHSSKPANAMLAPACLPGLTHVEITVGALVEIIHAFACSDLDNIPLATKLYVRLLMCEDQSVSFAAKQALIKVMRPRHKRRKVVIPSPQRCSSPPPDPSVAEEEEPEDKAPQGGGEMPLVQEVSEASQDEPSYEVVEQAEPMVLEPAEGNVAAQGVNQLPLEALLGGRSGGFAPMLDIPPDADDEAMMELAIALSLQDQSSGQDGGGGGGGGLNLQALGLAAHHHQGQSSSSLEAGTLSDTTASAASDDEGSTAATDGSTLRTSPAEHAGSGGSESGGSAVDSITGEHSASGRSSAYGDGVHEPIATRPDSAESSGHPGNALGNPLMDGVEMPEGETETERDHGQRMHALRLMLLDRLLQYLPELRDVGGVRAIPFMQVVLMLSSDLDIEEDKDRHSLGSLLSTMLAELNLRRRDFADVAERTAFHEVQLIIMRLLSVFMSRTKSGTKAASESSTLISHATASALLSWGAVDYCLLILKALLDHWKETDVDEDASGGSSNLLKPHPTSSPPDMSPFFLRQYVKGHAGDVFEAYPQLLTEMVLRLPYQMKKICDATPSVGVPVFDQAWFYYLCEYMMTQQTPFVRRQVRKLLLFICGSKDKYRQLRDLHTLESHLRDIKSICSQNGLELDNTSNVPITLPYDTLITLIEHLKACQEIAASRTLNWQKFCHKDETVLSSLQQASFYLDEGVSPLLLQLLTCALCGNKTSSSKHKKSKEKAEKSEGRRDKSSEDSQRHDDSLCQSLINQLNRLAGRDSLSRFVRQHLLESNNTSVRWQAHGLLLHIFRSSQFSQQEQLLELMWELWPELSSYGRKAAQFVDLLGYFSLKAPYSAQKSQQYVQKAAALLKTQNQCLANHPNSTIYNMLSGLVQFDGYFLESDPCLVCNNPEVPFSNLKLTTLKVDSRYTANSQIVKLVGTHTIAKVSLRISDLKRTKMVRTINIYYNNRTVQSVVELKNKPTMWHKARKCQLAAGQTELKVEFPLPIVAANLMIEYADFYDNLTASAETLQCPRCSASVPANPGVCGNCGENVFQCHKCRAINYDEKDPYLCNACGFCKYAKFDYTLTARACCAVDPIETEDDRKKATSTISSLLEKADRVYRQLVSHKPHLEALLIRVHEAGQDKPQDGVGGAASSSSASVNKTIQQLAQRYCGDCKGTFDELSKIIQKVLASRKELVEYDRRQRDAALKSISPSSGMTPVATPLTSPHPSPSPSTMAVSLPSCKATQRNQGRCYGCAAAATEHCVTLLRGLASHAETRRIIADQGLIQELVEYNLRRGSAIFRSEVRQLLALLTRDNADATHVLNDILMARITAALNSYKSNPDLAGAVRNEMALLVHSVEKDDPCWEKRLKCVMKLFLIAVKTNSPVVMENVTLPCLRILHLLVKPPAPASKKNKDKNVEHLSTVKPEGQDVYINVRQWLAKQGVDYNMWKQRIPASAPKDSSEKQASHQETRGKYLMEKYARRWKQGLKRSPDNLHLGGGSTWLRGVLFSPSSRAARQVACNIVESLCQVSSRRQQMLDLLTSYLDEVGPSGESAAEFLTLYQRLTKAPHWKLYLAAKGLLPHVGVLITKEIDILLSLEETTLSSDLSQGYALKMLTELLASFLEVDTIRRHYKSKLLGPVLNGYLALRKLVVQRTKLVDETQQMLLELLEDMTTGTESETRAFMAVCVDTVKRYGLDDLRTPVFIFERLCSIIYPEENDVGVFFMTLEKDPQQEDFLQGRMQGNPYNSNEPDMGPLMRDIKNKICRDCELIALLEDDTGMELLVNNKIISLDLPVKYIYQKIWCPENEGEPMRIIYRMRGLLGDATEDIIESVDNNSDEEADDEETYKMAGVMSECEGLEIMLHRLACLTDLVRGRQLLAVLLKLLCFCTKVKVNRQRLIEPAMQAVNIMLAVLNRVLLAENEEPGSGGGTAVTEQLLSIMEVILQEANNEPLDHGKPTVILACDKSQLVALLDRINSPFVRSHSSVLQGLMRIIPFLSFGDKEKMTTLVLHFEPYLDFDKFDGDHTQDDEIHLECFCAIAAGIENNSNGNALKDLIIQQGIVGKAVGYITRNLPKASNLESPPWKEFLAKPSLPYVLRLLTGLCTGHPASQLLVGAECILAIHRMEQISSEEGIGSLSENLMESIKLNPEVAKKIDEVRAQTKAEKKRLAMAMRQKQLGALGMSTNEKGQVTAERSVLKQMEELVDESGLTCCICREGYKYQPQKVLGIYTFTKCHPLEEYETKSRKTQGYSTVSHFNIVHYDCHMAAVRHARGREEWESAALQNANTKCNGLLPLWGPQVPESAFASCLARHNIYLQECTGHHEPNYHATIHDIKLLLQRFAMERSFSNESGGGGRQSNIHLLPYMLHMALYVINTTRSVSREEKNLATFLKSPPSKWVEASFEIDGPFYYSALCPVVLSPEKWKESRVVLLKMLLAAAHVRHISPMGATTLTDKQVKDYIIYKPALVFFSLLDSMYQKLLTPTPHQGSSWPVSLAHYIRHNDEAMLKAGDEILYRYEVDCLPCESFGEFCDVTGLLGDIQNPDQFLADTISSMP
ncbi:E3 ubiquitin-protein ligase UBR4-like isoform X1 [Acanthaster planci]|uniref:E3 ubiquitin-protein ligase UBR4-like isoform X1 n=1 Tax=Acanthaster planci TaxID=133434 RepID=A0A8B7XWM1_ACAPL|nr:E3 ubiquitin-protein ligase UBR4-like isoform X1 [Acanthaster planci]